MSQILANRGSDASKYKFCRLIKTMDYTRETVSLIPTNRNSTQNKNLRRAVAVVLIKISEEKILFKSTSVF